MSDARPNGFLNNLNWRRVGIRGGIVVVVVTALVYLFVFSKYGYLRMRELQRENGDLEKRVSEVESENEELQTEIGRLEDDMEAVERLAREELGLVKEGETIYRFIEVEEEE
ncbi:MAG: septum formation initiator family protein [bacterium]|nr:septum formation initiator family protein [bacterium]